MKIELSEMEIDCIIGALTELMERLSEEVKGCQAVWDATQVREDDHPGDGYKRDAERRWKRYGSIVQDKFDFTLDLMMKLAAAEEPLPVEEAKNKKAVIQ